ncbi:MAG: hypothetical protein WBE09_16275 [Candidatus Acidiferrales bacterium]
MKTGIAILAVVMVAGVASAQSPDASKWMCRNLAESGGFLYQGETVFGTQACRPIQQAPAAQAVAPQPAAQPAESQPAAAQPAAVQPAANVAAAIPAPNETTPIAATAITPVQPADAPRDETPVRGFVLEDGTPVHLVLSENLSSADAVTGQTVEFEVVDDVIVNGLLVIPRGSTAWATVTDAEHKRRMGRAGKLDLNIDKVRLGDGEKALLRAVKDMKAGGHTGAMVGAMVATSLVVWPAAPLFLLMHGKDVTIPKGTDITAFVQGDVTLDYSRFQRQLAVAR